MALLLALLNATSAAPSMPDPRNTTLAAPPQGSLLDAIVRGDRCLLKRCAQKCKTLVRMAWRAGSIKISSNSAAFKSVLAIRRLLCLFKTTADTDGTSRNRVARSHIAGSSTIVGSTQVFGPCSMPEVIIKPQLSLAMCKYALLMHGKRISGIYKTNTLQH